MYMYLAAHIHVRFIWDTQPSAIEGVQYVDGVTSVHHVHVQFSNRFSRILYQTLLGEYITCTYICIHAIFGIPNHQPLKGVQYVHVDGVHCN